MPVFVQMSGGTFHDSDGLLGISRQLRCRRVRQVLGEHISQAKHSGNWKCHVPDGRRRWQTAYSDSIWPWSGYHRRPNIPSYIGFSQGACFSLIVISSLLAQKNFTCFVYFDTIWVLFGSFLMGSTLSTGWSTFKCQHGSCWAIKMPLLDKMVWVDYTSSHMNPLTSIIWCHF